MFVYPCSLCFQLIDDARLQPKHHHVSDALTIAKTAVKFYSLFETCSGSLDANTLAVGLIDNKPTRLAWLPVMLNDSLVYWVVDVYPDKSVV